MNSAKLIYDKLVKKVSWMKENRGVANWVTRLQNIATLAKARIGVADPNLESDSSSLDGW
jgi:hypothetical protein